MRADNSDSDVSPAQIRAQRDRILQSKVFSLSKRHAKFLDYIVNAALDGHADKVKEFAIGIDVFEKDGSFDPGSNSIVRVEASRLRAKLREYYVSEGAGDPVRIDIPKGQYAPVFYLENAPDASRNPPQPRRFLSDKRNLFTIAVMAIAIIFFITDRGVFEHIRSNDSAEIMSEPSVPAVGLRKSIAVLPFRNRSAIAEDAYFVDGIHDDILTQLSKLSSLDKVISRTSMEQYRDTTKSLREIGDELGVATILEGGVQRSGDRIRLNAQLIDVASDTHVWANTYDRELTTANIFAIQSELALSIANALHATLSPEEQRALENVPTEDLRAYELFQRAQLVRRTLGLGSRDEVTQLLERAVSLDPDFALAYVSLARAYIDRYFTRDRQKSHRALARIALDKALELDPGMPAAHIALADYYYKGFLDYDQAMEQLEFAMPLSRGNAEAYAIRAFVHRRRGNFEAALVDLAHAIQLDPGNFSPHYVLADTYVILGQYEQAITYYDRAIQLAPNNFGLRILRAYALRNLDINSPAISDLTVSPAFLDRSGVIEIQFRWEIAMSERDYDLAMNVIELSPSDAVDTQFAYYPLDLMRGMTEFYLGDRSNAAEYFNSALVTLQKRISTSRDDPRYFSALAFAHAGLRQRDEAVEAANTAYELHPVSKDAVDGSRYVLNYAATYAMLGESGAAIEKLDELLSIPGNWYATSNTILSEPAFEKLRDEAAFESLMDRHRLR